MDNNPKENKPANSNVRLSADRAYRDLISIAARLVMRKDLPSDCAEDYPQKNISTRKMARMMERAHRAHREIGMEIRKAADALKADNV